MITRYRIAPVRWPRGLSLRLAILSDIHACEPWVSAPRIRSIVEQTNALGADLILLLGDYSKGHRWTTGEVHSAEWSAALSGLKAPFGVHAVLGNHDWWDDLTAQKRGHGPTYGQRALEAVGIRVHENRAIRLQKDDQAFWLAGLGDQIALLPYRRYGRSRWQGMDDLPGTLAQIDDDGAPVILMAHEPDIFSSVPSRVSLTVSGHTHGGQVRFLGWSPVVPSRHGNRYAYGHIREHRTGGSADLIVSGGIGESIMPIRFGVPPEVVVVDLGAG